jgi:hypothetical protein
MKQLSYGSIFLYRYKDYKITPFRKVEPYAKAINILVS